MRNKSQFCAQFSSSFFIYLHFHIAIVMATHHHHPLLTALFSLSPPHRRRHVFSPKLHFYLIFFLSNGGVYIGAVKMELARQFIIFCAFSNILRVCLNVCVKSINIQLWKSDLNALLSQTFLADVLCSLFVKRLTNARRQ
jgi:hypothetical protein